MSKAGSSSASSPDKPPFMAFVTGSADLEALKTFAAAHQWAQADINQGDIKTATEFLKNHTAPTLLLVELPSAAEAPALLDALADVCDPATKVITVGAINEYSFYCWLMDIGIFNYLLKPLTQPMLEGAYAKSQESPQAQAKQGKQPGKVVAVMGTRGGVGATTVALNLAGLFAEVSKKPIALVDMDPQGGSVALALDIEPSRGLREVMEKPDRIDSLFIERAMVKPHKHLAVLGAEEALNERIAFHDNAAPALIKELRDKFELVVLDIPRHINANTLACLKQADYVILVTELTLLSLRDALRLSDMMRDSLKIKPPLLVANRTGMVPKQEMQVQDFENGINAKITCSIPFVPEVFMQIGTDIPSVKMKTHVSVKPFYTLAEKIMPEVKHKPEISGGKKFNWFKK